MKTLADYINFVKETEKGFGTTQTPDQAVKPQPISPEPDLSAVPRDDRPDRNHHQ
jgi:hypothetical protein